MGGKSEQVAVRITKDTHNKLAQLAKEFGQSRRALVEQAIKLLSDKIKTDGNKLIIQAQQSKSPVVYKINLTKKDAQRSQIAAEDWPIYGPSNGTKQ